MKKKASKKQTEDSEDLDVSVLEEATIEATIPTDDINEDEEAWFIQKLIAKETLSGMIVETKLGRGQTKNGDTTIDGKIPVYLDDGRKLLCRPENVKPIGFYD
jgi:hypothetical protein